MSFAAIHIPEFLVAARLRDQPELGFHAFVVLEGKVPQERVVARNQLARELGIEHGMSKVQTEAVGSVQFFPRDLSLETRAFREVEELAERFSPRVEAIAGPANSFGGGHRLAATLLLDRSGTTSLFGPAESYAAKLHKELSTAGFMAGVATATNAEVALLLARASLGITTTDERSVAAKLAPLPVSLLACEQELLQILARWGIRALGQLAKLPETALISRLGQKGHRLQHLARGTAEHFLVPEEPEFTLSVTTELDTPLENLESLRFVLFPLLEQVIRKAIERAYALRIVRLELKLEKAAPHQIQIRPAVPTSDRELLLKLLSLELEAYPPRAGILTVTLSAEPSQPQTAQRGLFQSTFPEPDRLDLLLARLRSIVGEGNVGAPELRDSHAMDAFTIVRYRPHLAPGIDSGQLPGRRAMRTFRPPHPVRVQLHEHKPVRLYWQQSRFEIAEAAGPWHASGCWWDEKHWDADEWDILTTHPCQLLRLRLENASQAWSVVGFYD